MVLKQRIVKILCLNFVYFAYNIVVYNTMYMICGGILFAAATDWPRSFLHPRCICLVHTYTYVCTYVQNDIVT